MKLGNNNRRKGFGAILLVLALTVAIPFAALAQTTTPENAVATDATSGATGNSNTRPALGNTSNQTQGKARQGVPGQGRATVDLSALTDAQKEVYTGAVTLMAQVEDAVLADLVKEGVVAQADVEAYTALRAAKQALAALDQSAWTAEQYKAYYEANAKSGEERKAALSALVEAGQLTQEQVTALTADQQSDLWAKIRENANTNSAIQSAMNTMQQAQQTMNTTLRKAEIVPAERGMMGGSNDRQGNANGQNSQPAMSGSQMPDGNRTDANGYGNQPSNDTPDGSTQSEPAQSGNGGRT